MKILDVPQSGSLAGQTSSRNRFGQYRRSRATPVNPNTSRQSAVRSYLSDNSQTWQTLDATTQAAWQYYADSHPIVNSLGVTVYLTGHMMFNAVNTRLRGASIAAVTMPPNDPFPDAPALGAVVLTTDTADGNAPTDCTIAYTPTPVPAATSLLLFGSPPVSAGVNFNGDYRYLLKQAAAAATPIDPDAALLSKWGGINPYRKMFFRAQLVRSDGAWSPWSNIVSGVFAEL